MSIEFPGPTLDVGLIVGHVDETSARVWVRLESEHEHRLVLTDASGARTSAALRTSPAADHTAVARLQGLSPDTRYSISLEGPEAGRFTADLARQDAVPQLRTLPRDARRLCFAFASCHLPYEPHGTGSAVDSSVEMYDALLAVAEERDVRFVLHLGDQIYADPERIPSLDVWKQAEKCTAHGAPVDADALFRATYRAYWAHAPLRRVHARLPNVMIWDDGEIRDVWGSEPLFGDAAVVAPAMFAAARDAFLAYQRSHGPPPLTADTFCSSFDAGPASFFVLDLRAVRDALTGTLLGEAQWGALERWLAATDDRPIRFLASSVPLLHTPDSLVEKITRGPLAAAIPRAFLDRWSADAFHPELVRLLDLLRGRRVVVLAGDIHIGAAIDVDLQGHILPQWISSAITHRAKVLHRIESELTSRLASIASPWPLHAHFHEMANNFGIVEIEQDGASCRATFDLYVHAPGGAKRLYRVQTPW